MHTVFRHHNHTLPLGDQSSLQPVPLPLPLLLDAEGALVDFDLLLEAEGALVDFDSDSEDSEGGLTDLDSEDADGAFVDFGYENREQKL